MTTQPLTGLKVIDAATLFAGPVAAMLLGDYGADVLKIEHPRGDPARTHGPSKDGRSLWWTMMGRNKRAMTLNIGRPEGAEIFRRLASKADIIIENFRPGTLERWGLGYDVLSADNPGLILVRVTGFGQFGPHSHRPGFGTLAEAMSGFADMTGQPDGPPTLPPFGLADGITGFAAAFAAMTAVNSRTRTGRGQVIDIALIEPILTILGTQAVVYDQLGIIPDRTGNRSRANAPRNTYETKDKRWLAISTSSDSIAERLMRLVGADDLVDQPWFSSARGRVEHVEDIDERVAAWIAERTADEAVLAIEAAEAAVAPVYNIADIFADPQFAALKTIIPVNDPVLGDVRMQNVMFRMSRDSGAIHFTGRELGADNQDVLGQELGLSSEEIARLKETGTI
ncbi:CoA transferase [Sphingomonas sp. PAMC26645]|uniref:CaiB/BaiF CoA transferase family protein n=1 Tax=Sphingomonas sp. PAMC26645 TaxID=2565555 RepID=UPI00109E29DC|nr:CoA transferase [Sphingomonas sp. PAMC26645]QCB43267.1 CoA transferase [Sphingomonas sp. PAMC26645]